MENKKIRIKELINTIKYHNDLYWNQNNSEISDIEYDKLIEKLRKLSPNNKLLDEFTINTSLKIKHKIPMLSLNKVYSIEKILEWCRKVARDKNEEFLIQLKLDGCGADYSNGILSTRGDGHVGENITNKLPIIKILSKNDNIRGEIVFTKSEFDKYKILKKNEKVKTSRNTCSGILHRNDIDTSFGKILTLVPFNFISKRVKLNELEKFTESNWKELIEVFQNSEFPADGIVFKLVDTGYSNSLGNTSHHPHGQMALKFTNPTEKSILREVIWQVGKRKLTPVGKIDPVMIGGVLISNVNLHNYKYILDKDIHINDMLVIERSGDVIPNVQKVIYATRDRKEIKLDYCPICNCPIDYRKPELYCTNGSCEGKLLISLYDSVIRLGIENLGKPTIKKLIDLGVCNIIDILKLTIDDIIKLEGFAEISSRNLYNEIQKIIKEGVYDWQILASLNIEGVGVRMSKILLTNKSFNQIQNMTVNEFESIEGIGYKIAIRIYQSIAEKRNYISNLLSTLKIKEKKTKKSKTICFTGKLKEKRSYYEAMARSCGYEIVKNVTKDLTVLICSDMNSNSSKIKKAKKLKIEIRSMI